MKNLITPLFSGPRVSPATGLFDGPVPSPVTRLLRPLPQSGRVPQGSLCASRRVFWRVYSEWTSLASDAELAQLERALAEHAPHVRPIHAALGDAMRDPDHARAVPLSLLASLDAARWKPECRPIAAQAAA
jgi:hypothetical protein